MEYGYLRVSTQGQDFRRQDLILSEYNLAEIFAEKISGKTEAKHRPEFERMLRVINPGDTVYFESMSRMGRSIQDVLNTITLLTDVKKIKVVFLKENMTIGGNRGLSATDKLFVNIMAAMAQFERDIISQRTSEGVRAAQASGKRVGAEKQITTEQESYIRDNFGTLTYKQIAYNIGMSEKTVQRFVKKEGMTRIG